MKNLYVCRQTYIWEGACECTHRVGGGGESVSACVYLV